MQTTSTDLPLRILQSTFGYHCFRGPQRDIVQHVTGGGDALVLMPTGGGKSLCYQIPAIARSGVGIVVSPLIALMQDQVNALRQLGVRAALINSSLSPQEAYDVEQRVPHGEFDLVYVAPERLTTDRFLQLLDRTPLALFAIDEAHCVSQWGHDFRQDYLQLAVLGDRYPGVPRIACTATADGPTRRDIVKRLGLQHAKLFVSGFDRPNIQYSVVPKQNGRQQLLRFVQAGHAANSGIVYCMTRRKVEETARWLADHNLNALPYHAGLDRVMRQQHLHRFLNEEAVIVVATIAFGMGIDKPDVRFVCHLDVPKSLESYYQETGRAGRDGLPADAWMTYGFADAVQLRQLVVRSEADESHKRLEHQKLNALLGFCETTECRRHVLLRYFGDQPPGRCDNCDTCLRPVEAWDGTVAAQKALSCVYRTDQRFGAGYLTGVLLGDDDGRIRSFGHDHITTFGVGKDLSKKQWLSVFRQLVAAGLLTVDCEHGSLQLTAEANSVLKGQRQIHFRQDPTPTRTAKTSKPPRSDVRRSLTDPTDVRLFESLRAKRLELATAQNVPPYVIFHDATLLEMVRVKPQQTDELVEISGVGETKLKRYGQAFIETIRTAGLAPNPKPSG